MLDSPTFATSRKRVRDSALRTSSCPTAKRDADSDNRKKVLLEEARHSKTISVS